MNTICDIPTGASPPVTFPFTSVVSMSCVTRRQAIRLPDTSIGYVALPREIFIAYTSRIVTAGFSHITAAMEMIVLTGTSIHLSFVMNLPEDGHMSGRNT
jgi:hypothetical protein